MRIRRTSRVLVAACVFAAVMGLASDAGKSATVNGYVLNSACAFTKGVNKPISSDCAEACAKAGSPLVILADDETIDWPIADTTRRRDRTTSSCLSPVKE